MRITELLTKETIAMDLDASDKSGVITELVNQLDKAGKLSDPVSFKEAIHNRESQEYNRGLVKVLLYHMLKLQQLKHLQLHSVNLKKCGLSGLDMQPALILYDCSA